MSLEFRLGELGADEYTFTYYPLADHDSCWSLFFWRSSGRVIEVHGGTQNVCVNKAIAELRVTEVTS